MQTVARRPRLIEIVPNHYLFGNDPSYQHWFDEVWNYMKTHVKARRKVINKKDWQLAARDCILTGSNLFIIAPTGGGKTICYIRPLMAKMDGTILVICGLLSLMADQE